ncbi:MAG: RecQ family ATP-dependent DNA helicase [Lautropia sp.]|nr:RecQ family ATP-dependent DNA helicase [Lautropia sp.]
MGKQDQQIHLIGALRWQQEQEHCHTHDRGPLAPALQALDAFVNGSEFVLGHNIIHFDLPHLRAASPSLSLLSLPTVDTLWLNPLAFPRNPYHHLVKHTQEGRLTSGQRNNPVADARTAARLFVDQFVALRACPAALLTAWHWLCSQQPEHRGFDQLFSAIRQQPRPADDDARSALRDCLHGKGCITSAEALLKNAAQEGWNLAYVLAWLSVAGGNSVIPPWVRKQFPHVRDIVDQLRDTPCGQPDCTWCTERHDAVRELQRIFQDPNIRAFRPEPIDKVSGKPLQQVIVEQALARQHTLGILPTGTGKSLCYQVPVLSRFEKTGDLAVVISPLVALMEDQVNGLAARGIHCAAAINGLLSMQERAETLERLRLGELGILIIAPEQLRNRTVRTALNQREIGYWVFDEAHCVSKWGHDFRPDYRYASRYIRERAGDDPIPPILCLTATAKPDVVDDMVQHFQAHAGAALIVKDGGAERQNLSYDIIETTAAQKNALIHELLQQHLPASPDDGAGAIIYCASRKHTEEVAAYLDERGVPSGFFHAGLKPSVKKETQQDFIAGKLRAMAATNAFGMGIDKPDVRLVIHADIPGSLENYLQEAGRAGRDRAPAHCILLYTEDDVERQFGMSARSRLSQKDIRAVLQAVRRLAGRRPRAEDGSAEVVATSGEILREDDSEDSDHDRATDDTRVRTALAWLEEARLLQRNENLVTVFPSSLRVPDMEAARRKLQAANLFDQYQRQLQAIVQAMFDADETDGISTDALMAASGLEPAMIRKAMQDLERLSIISDDTRLTAFVDTGIRNSSRERLEHACQAEAAIIKALRTEAPDMQPGESHTLDTRLLTQQVRDELFPDTPPGKTSTTFVQPMLIEGLIRGMTQDRPPSQSSGNITLKRLDRERFTLTLNTSWDRIQKAAEVRRDVTSILLNHLVASLGPRVRAQDQLASTTIGALRDALMKDIALRSMAERDEKNQGTGAERLLTRGLLWMHERKIIQLSKGTAIFRPAMTLRLAPGRGMFNKEQYEPLATHYDGQVAQIQIMNEYAQRALKQEAGSLDRMQEALALVRDYFSLKYEAFLKKWLPNAEATLRRQTSPASWNRIVDSLNNEYQRQIVMVDREKPANELVLAGPGSGKTRTLVHRIAYLVRALREPASSILAITYNRHAALEIRRRLHELIGADAQGVMVMTIHAMAMRLTGISLNDKVPATSRKAQNDLFRQIIRDATALLTGHGADSPQAEQETEVDETRDRLLAGFRWILIDEYQDIERCHYDLISALAGRTLGPSPAVSSIPSRGTNADHDEQADDRRLHMFAVGDDDQNIYGFNDTSVEFIHSFGEDYNARISYLVENFRSTAHIIAAANRVIAPAANRMKVAHPIRINDLRRDDPPGGWLTTHDPVAQGRVQILQIERSAATSPPVQRERESCLITNSRPDRVRLAQQAWTIMTEFMRLKQHAQNWSWARCAVIAREWSHLQPIRAWCEQHGVPVQLARDAQMPLWSLRETQQLVQALQQKGHETITATELNALVDALPESPWRAWLQTAVDDYAADVGNLKLSARHARQWLGEWCREARQQQQGLLLVTVHGSKGLEFDHVAILDGGWTARPTTQHRSTLPDPDEERRLFYVAMTRARQSLMMVQDGPPHPFLPHADVDAGSATTQVSADDTSVLTRTITPPLPDAQLLLRYETPALDRIDLGYSGRQPASASIHHHIQQLQAGDALQLQHHDGRWLLKDVQGHTVGRMSKQFAPQAQACCVRASVRAVIVRDKAHTDDIWRERCRVDQWEVVVPELVWEDAMQQH